MRHQHRPSPAAAALTACILLTAVAPLAFLLGGPFAWALLALSAPLVQMLGPIGDLASGPSAGLLLLSSPAPARAAATPVSANAFAPRPPPASSSFAR